jgi:glycosyltransferase involved in cell wall biosynthesis
MATYNEDLNFLNVCIDSILRQTFQDFEFIIVIEPGEKNKGFLEKVADADKRVMILENESRLGLSGSRNRAIKEGCGEYIAFIDGDDYCDIKRFKRQIRFLESNPEISVVGSNLYLIDGDNNITGERRYSEAHGDIKKAFLLTMGIANPAVMLRRRDLDEVGFFDSRFSKAEDFELWLRFLALNKRMYNFQENLVYYRIPASHNDRRGRVHWKNNYIARKRHSKFIWPAHQRVLSTLLYFFISHIPEGSLDNLLQFKIIDKIKNIRIG